ncbi:hypothetical protein DQL45_21415 (plasmid) [Cereibacter sphaeroides 2.4.1]|nr:hypothetical protein DQL45_21415 [Cereibacter sphaeroides 2.4.1]
MPPAEERRSRLCRPFSAQVAAAAARHPRGQRGEGRSRRGRPRGPRGDDRDPRAGDRSRAPRPRPNPREPEDG